MDEAAIRLWVEKSEQQKRSGDNTRSETEAPKLIGYKGQKPNGTKFDMWYI